MTRLRILDLSQTDISESAYVLWDESEENGQKIPALFPSLQQLYVSGSGWLNQSSLVTLFNKLGAIAPSLKRISLKSPIKINDCLPLDLIDSGSLPSGVYIETNSVQLRKNSDGQSGIALEIVELFVVTEFLTVGKRTVSEVRSSLFSRELNLLSPQDSSLHRLASYTGLERVTFMRVNRFPMSVCRFGIMNST